MNLLAPAWATCSNVDWSPFFTGMALGFSAGVLTVVLIVFVWTVIDIRRARRGGKP